MAEAEAKIGDVSEKYAAEAGRAMALARSADLAGATGRRVKRP